MSSTSANPNLTGTPSPSPSPSQSDSDTATLYLFTFLATILILVLLSASLVLRSYILRRRYRQRFQQALADNALFADFDRSQFDPLRFRRSARRLGPKPILWDTWVLPVDEHAWSSFTPVAVRCAPSSPPSTSHSYLQPSSPPTSPPSLFSHLRLLGPFSHSHPASPPPVTTSPARSLPLPPSAPSPNTRTEKDISTLAVCVFIAMPDPSAKSRPPLLDAKGKGVDPLESQVPPQSGDADPLLPSSHHRSSASRVPNFALDEPGSLPLLEFGVLELKTPCSP